PASKLRSLSKGSRSRRVKPIRVFASACRTGRPPGLTRARGVAACAFVPLVALGSLALARSVQAPAIAPPPFEDPAPTAIVTQRGGVSLDQAIRLASERYPGRVVRAETTTRGGRTVHGVRILMEGEGNARMRIVRIDAESGRFL